MPRHRDDEPVVFEYASLNNIKFRGEHVDSLMTWGEWRRLSRRAKGETLAEIAQELVDVWVKDDEQ